MRLVSIKLHNIRSYTNATINFSSSSNLLAGDIGSGKSSILLAIEFALFGLMTGTLSGGALLRNGKNEGSAELKFMVENKEVIIKRTLKRLKDRVVQQSGFIIMDGLKKELTATELKSEVINLLGYPPELASKSKNMIYRYTVYTPQEEMKQIILENKEERLETLRRVFGIDKYKRIRENAANYIRELGVRKRLLEAKISDLPAKEKRQDELLEAEKNVKKIVEELKKTLEQLRIRLEDSKKTVALLEEKSNKARELKMELSHLAQTLSDKLSQRDRNSMEMVRLGTESENLEKELSAEKISGKAEQELNEKNSILKELEKRMQDTGIEIGKIRWEQQSANDLSKKITSMGECPTCLQTVAEKHKQDISIREGKKASLAQERLMVIIKEESDIKKIVEEAKAAVETQRNLISRMELLRFKARTLDDKRKQIAELTKFLENFKKEVGEINSRKIDRQRELDAIDLGDYEIQNKAHQALQEEEKKISMEWAGHLKELEGLKRESENVRAEISMQLKFKDEILMNRRLCDWFENTFMNLAFTMEKQVMAQLHQEFSTLLLQWFKMLIEDEMLAVRLDDEFTPVIEQNGYELLAENLSGGEKTALALAYRFALNRVINDTVSSIKTKDIIILDEPTDGFSSEQLDKMKEVLVELKISQIIIVSHETKIEGFVDTVTRLTKEGHITAIV